MNAAATQPALNAATTFETELAVIHVRALRALFANGTAVDTMKGVKGFPGHKVADAVCRARQLGCVAMVAGQLTLVRPEVLA